MSELRLKRAKDYPKCECWPNLDPEAFVINYHRTNCSVMRARLRIKELKETVVETAKAGKDIEQLLRECLNRQTDGDFSKQAMYDDGRRYLAEAVLAKLGGMLEAVNAIVELEASILPAGDETA